MSFVFAIHCIVCSLPLLFLLQNYYSWLHISSNFIDKFFRFLFHSFWSFITILLLILSKFCSERYTLINGSRLRCVSFSNCTELRNNLTCIAAEMSERVFLSVKYFTESSMITTQLNVFNTYCKSRLRNKATQIRHSLLLTEIAHLNAHAHSLTKTYTEQMAT